MRLKLYRFLFPRSSSRSLFAITVSIPFESNQHTRYSTRMVQAVVEGLRLLGRHRKAGLPRIYSGIRWPRFCSIPARFLIDQMQKFLGHLHLSTTQIYAETSLRALGDNYVRALGGSR